MRMCVRKVVRSANRITMCFPMASTDSIRVPGAGRRPGRARDTSRRTSDWPSSTARSRWALRWMVSPSGTNSSIHQTLVAVDESGAVQLLDGGFDLTHRLTVDLADLERTAATAVDEHPQRIGPAVDVERHDAVPAPFEVGRELAIDEHHVCTGGARGPAAAVGPWQGRAVGLGRVGGRQHLRVVTGFAERSQTVDSSGQRELRGTEAGDEVPAPHTAAFFQRLQH